MDHQRPEGAASPARFGQRRVRPRVCVSDGKHHIRTFLIEALEELGFLTCECAGAGELGAVLDAQLPDLLLLGLSGGGTDACETLRLLARRNFDGKVLLLGPRASLQVKSVHEFGEELGLTMLPVLGTPFDNANLRASVASLLPGEPPNPPVDIGEALGAGWLELWYQPKIDTHTLSLSGAEALVRMRHPAWGTVPPGLFVLDDGDPHFRALSEFVIGQAVADWHDFVHQHGHVEIAINLPVYWLQDPDLVGRLGPKLPDHPAFKGLIIEINGGEVVENLDLVRDVARQLRFHNIGVSINDLGNEWPLLMGIRDFPFVEIKVDKQFVAGCAGDRTKRATCGRILNLADGYGSRTVAGGVESRADFAVVREMGFDLVQSYLLARPMAARKFARTMLGRPLTFPR